MTQMCFEKINFPSIQNTLQMEPHLWMLGKKLSYQGAFSKKTVNKLKLNKIAKAASLVAD